MGSPPEFLPTAFKKSIDCENYLTTKVLDKYFEYRLETTQNTKYLVRLDQKWIDKYHPTEKK